MNTKEYFPHDFNATENLVRIKRKFGHEGLGIFWELVEYLHRDKKITESLQNIEDLAYNFHADTEILLWIICESKFFERNKTHFWSTRIQQNIEKRLEISEKRSSAGRKGGRKTQALARVDSSKPEAKDKQIQPKERKGKEKKVLKGTESGEKISPTPRELATEFFSNKEMQKKACDHFGGIEKSGSEILKFINYWTELNGSGKKQRWQMEKTFDVKRRLVTWMNNSGKFSAPKGKKFERAESTNGI